MYIEKILNSISSSITFIYLTGGGGQYGGFLRHILCGENGKQRFGPNHKSTILKVVRFS
jgi:hypothetical protein